MLCSGFGWLILFGFDLCCEKMPSAALAGGFATVKVHLL